MVFGSGGLESNGIAKADDKSDFWILSLSGGGFRGLFTAKILEHLERMAGCPLARKFDLIAGTSVGSILAAAVAKELPTERLPGLFIDHGQDIFKRKSATGYKGLFKAQYSADSLKALLTQEDMLGHTRFQDLRHRLMIPAVNLTKGSAQYFKTQHNSRFMSDGRRQLVDAVMASAAAPTYFPIYTFEDQRYADGGLVANSPALAAIHEALYILDYQPHQIHVISIGTMNESMCQDTKVSLDAGVAQWGRSLVTLPMSAQETMSDNMAKHIVKDRWIKVDREITPHIANRVGLDEIGRPAQEALKGQAEAAAQEQLNEPLIRKWLKHTANVSTFFNQD